MLLCGNLEFKMNTNALDTKSKFFELQEELNNILENCISFEEVEYGKTIRRGNIYLPKSEALSYLVYEDSYGVQYYHRDILKLI